VRPRITERDRTWGKEGGRAKREKGCGNGTGKVALAYAIPQQRLRGTGREDKKGKLGEGERKSISGKY